MKIRFVVGILLVVGLILAPYFSKKTQAAPSGRFAALSAIKASALGALATKFEANVNGDVSYYTPPTNQTFSTFPLDMAIEVKADPSNPSDNFINFHWNDSTPGNVLHLSSANSKAIIKPPISGKLNGILCSGSVDFYSKVTEETGNPLFYTQVAVTKGFVWNQNYPDAVRCTVWKANGNGGWTQPAFYNRYGWAGVPIGGIWSYLIPNPAVVINF